MWVCEGRCIPKANTVCRKRLGTGVWFRVNDGHPVTEAAYAAADKKRRRRFGFSAVPRVAFLNGNQDLLDRATSGEWSCLRIDELTTSMAYEGRAIGKNEILDVEFVCKAIKEGCTKWVANHLPGEACPPASGADGRPPAATFGDRIVPLTGAFLTELLGTCHLPPDMLAHWNKGIQDGLNSIMANSGTVMVLNRAQVEWLIKEGVAPLRIFDPPPSGWLDEAVDEESVEASDGLGAPEPAGEGLPRTEGVELPSGTSIAPIDGEPVQAPDGFGASSTACEALAPPAIVELPSSVSSSPSASIALTIAAIALATIAIAYAR